MKYSHIKTLDISYTNFPHPVDWLAEVKNNAEVSKNIFEYYSKWTE